MAKPAASLKTAAAPGLQVAIWENERGFSVTIGKRFKTKDGTWSDASSFFASDLPALSALCSRALTVIDKLEANKRGSEPVESKPQPAPVQTGFKDDDVPF